MTTIRTRNALRLVPRTREEAGMPGPIDDSPSAGGLVAMIVSGIIGSFVFLLIVLGW